MNEFRIRATGAIVAESSLRALSSLPASLDTSVLDSIGVDRVYATAQPPYNPRIETVIRDGVVQNADGRWEAAWRVESIVPADAEARDAFLTNTRNALKAGAAALRYEKETGGVLLPNGANIRTDRESQAQLNAAYSSLKNGLIESTFWKADGGVWVSVTLTEIEPIAQVVANHVAACFAAERAHWEAIDQIDAVEALADYDVAVGWPGV